MQAPRTIILHLGWPKTGTTTLQRHVFPKLKGFRYLGKTPFDAKANGHVYRLVYALAYASLECFEDDVLGLQNELMALEEDRFGDVDTSSPAIISEEGVLSSLLKPSNHQHHGYSTASLEQLVSRLLRLEELWGVRFELLVSERDAMEILHSYYAQMYHVFRTIKGLETFRTYINVGTSDRTARDLGFRYLRPGYVHDALVKGFGEGRVHCIQMKDLFTDSEVRLSTWFHGFPEDFRGSFTGENRRSVSKDVRITHHRPIWSPKEPFRLRGFLSAVRTLYRERYLSHEKLEIPVLMTESDRELIKGYLQRRD